jgi:hypothetical protein
MAARRSGRALSFSLEHAREGLACALAQCVEARVGADAKCELRAIGLAQGSDQGVAALLADFTVEVAAPEIKAEIAVPFADSLIPLSCDA